tara:strand:- start:480 stop:929 length:450 start_codon:yes stop_codon:yes gene_type:complete
MVEYDWRWKNDHGIMVILIGLPGSGKSTWGKMMCPNHILVNGDALGTMDKVNSYVHSSLNDGLKRSILIDATNLTLERRGPLIAMAKQFGYIVYGMYFNLDVKTCLDRIKQRVSEGGSKVSRVAVYTLNKKTIIPSLAEGFNHILASFC